MENKFVCECGNNVTLAAYGFCKKIGVPPTCHPCQQQKGIARYETAKVKVEKTASSIKAADDEKSYILRTLAEQVKSPYYNYEGIAYHSKLAYENGWIDEKYFKECQAIANKEIAAISRENAKLKAQWYGR